MNQSIESVRCSEHVRCSKQASRKTFRQTFRKRSVNASANDRIAHIPHDEHQRDDERQRDDGHVHDEHPHEYYLKKGLRFKKQCLNNYIK